MMFGEEKGDASWLAKFDFSVFGFFQKYDLLDSVIK